MAEEAWGRWGEGDQRGALNWIDAAKVRAAAGLVKRGEVFNLAQPLSPGLAIPPARPRLSHFMARDGADYAAGQRQPGGFQFADDTVLLPLHTGTHIDALCHAWCGRLLYNGVPETEVRSFGASRLGVENIPPIVSRGVLLDFVALAGRPLRDGETIDVAMLRAALARAETTIEQGDVVLLRTGWLESRSAANPPDFDREPGIGVEAAVVLAEAGASIVGADNYALEALPFAEGTVFPVHQRLIRDYGVPLLEGLVLAPLAAAGARTFLFTAAPLTLVGATGSPLTPMAVL
jgi:kynurenine formamidase